MDIYDVINGYSVNKKRYCGKDVPHLLKSQSNDVKIVFASDVFNSERGFHIKYSTGIFL